MIEQIKTTRSIASFSNPIDIKPLIINYFYGGNGTGKTTLVRLLSGEISEENCLIQSQTLPVLTYNRDFIEKNFSQGSTIAGIHTFSLGEEQVNLQKLIKEKKEKCTKLKDSVNILTNSSGNIQSEINSLTKTFEEKCWSIKTTYHKSMPQLLTGFSSSKKLLAEHCIQEYDKLNDDHIESIDSIKSLYDKVFDLTTSRYKSIDAVVFDSEYENSELLEKIIVGRDNSTFSDLINTLNMSDWVRNGIHYANQTKGKCPYCQQPLSTDIKNKIESIFDEVYRAQIQSVNQFKITYTEKTNVIINQLNNIQNNLLPELDGEILRNNILLLTTRIQDNIRTIEQKSILPSTKCTIQSIRPYIDIISSTISGFNEYINKHNNTIDNRIAEQSRCKNLFWNFVVTPLKNDIQKYEEQRKIKEKDNENYLKLIKEKNEEIANLSREITTLENKTSEIHSTAKAINDLLECLGFSGFKLRVSDDTPNQYEIIRENGENAQKTLSEGEYNFVTFLYFYHLVYGSHDGHEIKSDKIVVIDDPVSSLDSNVLYIISTLVQIIINDCNKGEKGIKQVFVFTHNIYFHKEISFNGNKELSSKKYAFWVIRKSPETGSNIVSYGNNNPIKTSYELLWKEIKDIQNLENTQNPVILNVLRRILEYYFKLIGGINFEKTIQEFSGNDKYIFRMLTKVINEGSHFISDDYYICEDDATLGNYIRVFKDIFTKLGHESHYNMMMKSVENM